MLDIAALALSLVASVGEEVHPRHAAWFDPNANYDANASFEPNAGYVPEAGYDADALYVPDASFDAGARFEPMALHVRADLVARAAADDHGIPVASDVRTVLLGVSAWFDALEETDEPIVVDPPEPGADEDAGEASPPPSRAARYEQAAADHLRERYEALAEAIERRDVGDAKGAAAATRRAIRHATLADRALTNLEALLKRSADEPSLARAVVLAVIEEDLDRVAASLAA
ncbi:MAG: hypothetical protein ACF8XB_13985 [Planctomycetota bacterium JB042]